MKKIYMLFAALAFVGFGVLNAQTVLIDTDFSDLTPTPANDANKSSQGPYNTPKGEITWHGTKYNDLKNFPAIGETVDDKIDPAADGNSNVRFLRTGSNFGLTEGVPTNHFFQVTPNDDFVNGGKVTLLVSVNGTAKGINVYDASAAEYLGTIDISEIALYQKVPVEFILPADFSGKKTLSFTRAELDGSVGGVTFFTWNIKIETDIPVSVKPVLDNANVVGVEYYNISGANMGTSLDLLPSGVYIEVTKFDNGTVDTKKVVKN